MDIGVCVASHVGDIDYVVRAEALGFSHAWLADSQMLWSDCYATLALAAARTSTIRLGTGVAVSGTRPAPVHAAGIATINALAPGRTFFGIGSGNTAMRVMGQPPHRIREFDRYLETLAPLLRGEEAMMGRVKRVALPGVLVVVAFGAGMVTDRVTSGDRGSTDDAVEQGEGQRDRRDRRCSRRRCLKPTDGSRSR